jgi:hypothetical protein
LMYRCRAGIGRPKSDCGQQQKHDCRYSRDSDGQRTKGRCDNRQ